MAFWKRLRVCRKARKDAATAIDKSAPQRNIMCDACNQVDPGEKKENYSQTEKGTVDNAETQNIQKILEVIAFYEKALEEHRTRIRVLEEELAESKSVLSDAEKLERRMRDYAETPILNWADDCECRSKVSDFANSLKKLLH